MKFHWPSFLLGVAAGAAGATLWDRFRPIAVELTTAAYELGEAAWSRLATMQEDAEDVVAEARQRAKQRARVTPRRRREQAGRR